MVDGFGFGFVILILWGKKKKKLVASSRMISKIGIDTHFEIFCYRHRQLQ